MRTEIEALKEIRDRISYFCSRTDGKYDPPWAQEVIGIIDDVLITPYRQCKRFGAPFYVEVGTSIVAIRCASNHDVVWRADHSVHGKSTVDWAESVCTRMNQEAHKREMRDAVTNCNQFGNAAKLREALEYMFILIDGRHLVLECETTEEISGVQGKLAEARAALAAPPRNCDIARDWMRDLYAHFKPPASVKREMPPEWVDAVMAFCRWLVAPAKEKEGGNNGNE